MTDFPFHCLACDGKFTHIELLQAHVCPAKTPFIELNAQPPAAPKEEWPIQVPSDNAWQPPEQED